MASNFCRVLPCLRSEPTRPFVRTWRYCADSTLQHRGQNGWRQKGQVSGLALVNPWPLVHWTRFCSRWCTTAQLRTFTRWPYLSLRCVPSHAESNCLWTVWTNCLWTVWMAVTLLARDYRNHSPRSFVASLAFIWNCNALKVAESVCCRWWTCWAQDILNMEQWNPCYECLLSFTF